MIKDQSRARKPAFFGIALPVLLLFVLAGNTEPQTQAPQPYQISVNVDLVVLNATVAT